MSTSLLVSTNAVNCYHASMVNLIWFANEKCLSCQHWATYGHEIRHLAIQKCNHFASSVCSVCSNMWKSSFTHRHVNAIALHIFCGCNCKT